MLEVKQFIIRHTYNLKIHFARISIMDEGFKHTNFIYKLYLVKNNSYVRCHNKGNFSTTNYFAIKVYNKLVLTPRSHLKCSCFL